MGKLGIDCLQVEITRRCNMSCGHCYRGDAQDIDLSFDTIDNLLSQVDTLSDLLITGGEPLLAIPVLQHLFDAITANNIRLEDFVITTNGSVHSNDFLRIVEEINNYIKGFLAAGDDRSHVIVNVSIDKYHIDGCGNEFISNCRNAFANKGISVLTQISGNNPWPIGRGAELGIWETVKYNTPPNLDAAIDVWEPHKKLPACNDFNADLVKGRLTPYILCPIYLSAKGKLYSANCTTNYDYGTIDSRQAIYNLNNIFVPFDLLQAVKNYNCGRQICKLCMLKSPQTVMADEFYQKVDYFINLCNIAQDPVSGFDKEDQKNAQNDLREILELQKEFPDSNLYVVFITWLDEYKPLQCKTRYAIARNSVLEHIKSAIPA